MCLDETKKTYIKYRLATAEENLESAKILYDNNQLKAAANRAYYCVFHSMRAVLAVEGVDFKHHSGVIAYFRKEYIKTGIFPKNLSTIIQTTSMVRESSDYDDFYLISRDDAKKQIDDAEIFYKEIKKYIADYLNK